METVSSNYIQHAPVTKSKVERLMSVMHWTYGLLPIAAGADKFMHLLTNWNKYLAPIVTNILPISANAFMNIVGVVEIIAGILTLAKPKIGAVIVGLWLIGIALNLLLTGQYFDVAVRDIVIAIGVFCFYALQPGKTSGDKS